MSCKMLYEREKESKRYLYAGSPQAQTKLAASVVGIDVVVSVCSGGVALF
jgi:hypothetical protein